MGQGDGRKPERILAMCQGRFSPYEKKARGGLLTSLRTVFSQDHMVSPITLAPKEAS